jgi:hypothetical protein
VGDFNGDGLDDLAIGVPDESVTAVREGAVIVLLGEEGFGIDSGESPARELEHGREEVPSGAHLDTVQWGQALTSGDFDGDGHADLAVGAWSESDGALPSVGSVTVLYGGLYSDGFGNGGLDPTYWSEVVGGCRDVRLGTGGPGVRRGTPGTGHTPAVGTA